MKKHTYQKLKEKRPFFFFSGLTVALALTFLAFEYRSIDYSDKYSTSLELDEDDTEEQMSAVKLYSEVPEIPDPKPKKPKDMVIQQLVPIETNNPDLHNSSEIELPIDFNPDDMIVMRDEKTEPEPIPILLMPEVRAEYITGEKGMLEFVQSFKLPKSLKATKKELVIYVTFVVDEEGNVTDIETLREVGYGVDQMVVRHFEKMPKWKPAKQGVRNVRQRFNMPIRFIIN
jgi:protein TonB